MLLMQNNVVSSYLGNVRQQEDPPRRPHWPPGSDKFWPHDHADHPARHLNWASVASWFMRPEARTAPSQDNLLAPTVCTSIRCTVPGCSCECFTPGKLHIRYCETCSHGWVPHALDKLGFRHVLGQNAVEPVQLNVAFDIASLVLYGCQALPIRLKILLDRLFSVLQREEVVQVLRGFGWSQEDYARGYILQEPHGAVLDRWNICSPEEEPLVLQQFLRFGETRAITQQLLLHGVGDGRYLPRMEADIKKLLERRKEEERRSLKPPVSPALHSSSNLRVPPPPPAISPQHKPSPISFKLPPTGLTCTPATSAPSSPPNSSPISVSPLNKLQNMQPFDYRKAASKASPERRRPSEETSPPGLMNLSVTGSSVPCLPPPPLPSNPSMLSGHKSPSADYYLNTGSSEFGSDEDEEDDDNSQSALNLSRDNPGQAKMRPGHNRKNTTPVKRQWGSAGLPLNLGTQLINPATGKKRVQCNVCLKTFCDKGALKIHYSAVHLREMHKCTVEGCNMMFSSRRSRNRHSANPNPKLHSPHLRRKISPHDGRSAQNHPILMPPLAAGLNPLSFGPFPLLTPPPDLRHQAAALDLKQSLDLSAPKHHESRKGSNDNSENMDDYMLYDDDDDGIVVEGGGEDDYDMETENHNGEKHDDEHIDRRTNKRLKMSESDVEDDAISNMDSNEDSLSVVDNQSVKEENGAENLVTKSSRKRKNQNPTRCNVSHSVIPNESMSDDDSSNLVYQSHSQEKKKVTSNESGFDMTIKKNEEINENNNTIQKNDVKPREEEKGPTDLSAPDSKNEEAENLTVEAKKTPPPKDGEEYENVEEKQRSSSANGDSIKNEDVIDSTNALRQLENLSQGRFGELNRNQESYSIPFGGSGDPPSPARSNASSASSNGDSPSDDNDGQVYGHFQDGTFISTMEVPIDKDNPRMCTACGKVFQNHFGVKTHYQNVHLKLMHKCTVDGCNAAFPSKRSRDRHSANLNLHRKLLSTSLSDKAGMFLDSAHLSSLASNPSIHPEFLARLYADTQSLAPHLPPPGLLNGDRLGHPPLFLHPLGLPGFPGFSHLTAPSLVNGTHSSGSDSPRSAQDSPPPAHLVYADDEEDVATDNDGALLCRYCSKGVKDRSALKEHYEGHHLSDMYRCSVSGCPLVFVSAKRRTAHSEDEAAHSRSRAS
ncbi:zinc finger protein basonuclin-2 isoform X2 [Cimex lectularius]|uniref:C2H2-type domain-containing protein n=1 Tax=Cimex lectularius TaxID=79782 RepID=A0A8I6RSB9_CIMLE|nr:zinc finger protein basonuclin-2 isoform X2 [Cimex lectularius]